MSLKHDSSDEEALAVKVKTEDEIALQQDTEDEKEDTEEGNQSKKRRKTELDAFLNTDTDNIASMGRHDKDALKDLEQFSKRLQRSLEEVKRKRQDDERREKGCKKWEEIEAGNECTLCKKFNEGKWNICTGFKSFNPNGLMICDECYDKLAPKEEQRKCGICQGFECTYLSSRICISAGCDCIGTNFLTCHKCEMYFCDRGRCGACDACDAMKEEGKWYCEICANILIGYY